MSKITKNQVQHRVSDLESEFSSIRNLPQHYEQSYSDAESLKALSDWRTISAQDKVKNIVNLTSGYKHEKILEVGAGEGAILNELDITGFCQEIYALEVSKSAVQSINSRSIASLIECQEFDGKHIPYQDDCFDLVILSHVVEHVENPRQLIREAARVGRCLFVEVPLEYTWRLPSSFQWTNTGHINYFSPKLIRYLLQTCHLSVQYEIVSNPSKSIYFYHYGAIRGITQFLIKQIALTLAPSVASRIFSYHYSALCEKLSER